jgi:hypothetical protein
MRFISGQTQGARRSGKRWSRAFALLSIACMETASIEASRASPMPLDSIAPKDKEMPAPVPTPGKGRLGGTHRTKAPIVRFGKVVVGDGMSAELVRRVVRQNYGRYRLCYEAGLKRNPKLQGSVSLRFVIELDSRVSSVSAEGSALSDSEVVQCCVKASTGFSFPRPEREKVNVFFELLLFPGE